jgi:hypothetical protein
MVTTETYSYGYKTADAAERAIIDDMSNEMLSNADRPRVRSYKNKKGQRRYRILVDHDHGHYDLTTDLAYC